MVARALVVVAITFVSWVSITWAQTANIFLAAPSGQEATARAQTWLEHSVGEGVRHVGTDDDGFVSYRGKRADIPGSVAIRVSAHPGGGVAEQPVDRGRGVTAVKAGR